MSGFAGFVGNVWLMLLLGALFAKVMDITGAARSIAQLIMSKFGAKRAVPAIIVAGALLTYGGISSMVACFALYPIALTLFRDANLPRKIIPGAIGAGMFTFINMLPGNPSIMNIIPTKYLGTTPMAAPIIGIVCAIFTFVLTLVYFRYEIKKAQATGEVFLSDADTEKVLAKADELEKIGNLPNPLLALLPPIAVVVTLNVIGADIVVALVVGIALCAALFFKNLKGIVQAFTDGANGAAVTAMTAGAIVAIGSIIRITPGFERVVARVLEACQTGGSPLAIFAAATSFLCGLNASGMGGLSTTLEALAKPFLEMGVNPQVLHRVGVIASTSLDSLPHSGGVVALLTITGISYKEGYKPIFITTVCITTLALIIAVILGALLPIA